MNNEIQQQLIEKYIAAYNAFDIGAMTENLAETIEFKNIANGEVNMHIKGLDAFLQQAEQAMQLFEERQQKIQQIIFNADAVEIHVDYEAVVAMDLPNGMKKGERLLLKGTSIFGFENGKIISITDIS